MVAVAVVVPLSVPVSGVVSAAVWRVSPRRGGRHLGLQLGLEAGVYLRVSCAVLGLVPAAGLSHAPATGRHGARVTRAVGGVPS